MARTFRCFHPLQKKRRKIFRHKVWNFKGPQVARSTRRGQLDLTGWTLIEKVEELDVFCFRKLTNYRSSCTVELLIRDLLLCCRCAMRERGTASPEASTLPGRAQLPALRNGPKQLETLENHKGHLGDHVSPASPAMWN